MVEDVELQVRDWRQQELLRLHFTASQRIALLRLMEQGEVQLADVRKLVEKKGWTPEQAYLAVR